MEVEKQTTQCLGQLVMMVSLGIVVRAKFSDPPQGGDPVEFRVHLY